MFANNFGNGENVCCGLVHLIKEKENWEPPVKIPIPLISVNVNASVVHAVAQVEVTQVYVNKEEQPIEAIYYFPTNPDGAVTHFHVELEGRIIKGTVKPNKEAEEAYGKAIKNKTTAFLAEEIKADIFKIRVGFLKPGSQVKVIIGYVAEVKNEPGSNSMRFYIPTTIAPRYVSPSETDKKSQDIKNMKFSATSPAPFSLKVGVCLQSAIKSIESPTHTIIVGRFARIPGKLTWYKAIARLFGDTHDMDRDLVLHIVPEEIHKPRLYSEKLEDGSTAMMIHLVPSFKLDEQKTELIFVLDRSGSMIGKSIDLAKKALFLFLHSMPADCYFNVVGFGLTFEFLFPKSVKYDDGSLSTAIAHLQKLEADLEGTEILEPLKEIYKQPGICKYLRQMFVLTDGEIDSYPAYCCRVRRRSIPRKSETRVTHLATFDLQEPVKFTQNFSPMEELINLQSFDGSYDLDDKLSKILGKTTDVLKDVAVSNGLDRKVFATALAIALFTTKMADQKDLWDLIVVKAKKWLVKMTTAENADKIITTATALLML